MAADPQDPQTDAVLALHRFGFGPRADAKLAADPRGALLAELERPRAGRIDDPSLLTSAEAAQALRDFRQVRKAARLLGPDQPAEQKPARNPAPGPDMQQAPGVQSPDMKSPADARSAAAPNPGANLVPRVLLEEAKVRFDAAATADIGFVERLVWFWSNHFCVSASKGGGVAVLCGAYEREAIRPQVLGHFADMLFAVETHPAMLLYLDNARSIGPNSLAGRARGKGLNENLAREILELHTLGVRTIYSQADVTHFADVITGWTIVPPRAELPRAGEFSFDARRHEPGPQKVIDKVYPDTGVEQGRAVLAMLARHPATAKHVATKLARHFVADDPPLTLVDKLAKCFLETQGNLKEVAKTLVTAPESWAPSPRKLKRPSDWMISILRATGSTPPDIRPVLQAQNLLGEPLWRPPAPNGFADKDEAWIDGMAQRLDIATQAARRLGDKVDPKTVLDTALGPLASAETRQTINRAESRPQALALLFMAPEFQRR
jgi:uncharacterized protein (DUF1800 family)